METKKNKYDTNPLDPDVERKAEEVWGELGGSNPTQQVGGATREVGGDSPNEQARQNVYSEAPTRHFDNPPLEAPYQSVFVPPTYAPPTQYQSRQNIYQARASAPPNPRSVAGIGVPERWATTFAYAPAFIGLVVSLLELFLVPRKEVKVRFHAAQAVALHIAILIIQTLFSAISAISGSSTGGSLFKVAAFVFLLISMLRVWKDKPHRISPLQEPAQWFNEHIEPRNRGWSLAIRHFHCIIHRQGRTGAVLCDIHEVKPIFAPCFAFRFGASLTKWAMKCSKRVYRWR